MWADDQRSQWGAGLFRADRTALTENGGKTKKGNRDGKFSLTRKHHHLVKWLWEDQPLRKNLLLHLDDLVRQQIIGAGASGQAKVNALFRSVHNVRIDREVVRTLAQQYDYMARIREDKGGSRARTVLRREGIIILGPSPEHQEIARALGGEVPGQGEFVAHRVRRTTASEEGRSSAKIDGTSWVVARPGEQADIPAPRLPQSRRPGTATN